MMDEQIQAARPQSDVTSDVGNPPSGASGDAMPAAAPLPEPRLSRRAAWIAMGSVALALGLLWAASDLSAPPPDETPTAPSSSDEFDDSKAIGKAASLNYTVKDMNGVDVHLASYKGKIILLNFWATWCTPCKEEIPDLITLQTQYKDDIVVLGFSVDEKPEDLKNYAAKYQMNYPVLVGAGHENIQEAYGPLWGIPVTIIIDRDGRIAKKQSGIRSLEQFEREIKRLL
jgi:thiol-disulfide isomerase/thioredoxin